MITEPRLEYRNAQPYVAVRTEVTMQELSTAIQRGLEEVFAWSGKREIAPSGAPFIRYLVIDMEAQLQIELGVPVVNAVSAAGHICSGVLPAGCYASLIYTGLDIGIQANAALLSWGAEKGLVWDSWPAGKGEGFAARLETFLTDPEEEPNQAKWETKVAIRIVE